MRNKKLQTTVLSCFAVLMMSSISSPINALEDPQKTLQTPLINTINMDLSVENSDLSKLQVSAKRQEARINILQRNIDVLSDNMDTQKDKVSELNKTKDTTEKTLQESKEKKANVEKTLESKKENLNLLQTEDKTLKSLDERFEINKTKQDISLLNNEQTELEKTIEHNESIYKVYSMKSKKSESILKETNKEKISNENHLKDEFSKQEEINTSTDEVVTKIDDKMGSVIVDATTMGVKDPVKENLENTDIEYIQEVNEQRRIEAERLAEEARIRAEQEAAERARIAAEQARIEAERQAAIRARGQAIVDAAMSKRGSPYVWGASGPNTFDCSGLVYWACKQAGVYFTRTTAAELSKMGQEVSISELQPGDIVTLNTMGYVSHVVIYIGNGQIIHAPQTGDVVKTSSLSRYSRDKIVSCRRLYN